MGGQRQSPSRLPKDNQWWRPFEGIKVGNGQSKQPNRMQDAGSGFSFFRLLRGEGISSFNARWAVRHAVKPWCAMRSCSHGDLCMK
jgi:hypothetical protein